MPGVLRKKKSDGGVGPWVKIVESLANDVEQWAGERNWSVHREFKLIREGEHRYEVPVVRVRSAAGEVWLDPVGAAVLGAQGRVDIVFWPSGERVRLLRHGQEWQAVKDNDKRIRRKWGRALFQDLAGNPPPVWG